MALSRQQALGFVGLAGSLGALAFGPGAWARGDLIPGARYVSARGAALGDAFLPLGEDGASALFYNPANIGKIRQTNFEPLNVVVEGNTGYFGQVDLSFYKVLNLNNYAPTLSANPGKAASVAFGAFPNFFMRGFAFGVLHQRRIYATTDGTNIRYVSRFETIPTVGTGVRLAGGVVRLGYSLQWVHASTGDINVLVGSSPLGYNQQLKEGSALSHNAGIAITLPYAYLPSLNLVARNILGARYTAYHLYPLAKNSSGVPPTEPMTFDASFSVSPKAGPSGGFFNMVFEYRDILNQSGISYWGRGAVGLEYALRGAFFVRGGWGSGYPNAGIGLKRKSAEFSLTWFSEEVGRDYRDERDQRFILQYQIRTF